MDILLKLLGIDHPVSPLPEKETLYNPQNLELSQAIQRHETRKLKQRYPQGFPKVQPQIQSTSNNLSEIIRRGLEKYGATNLAQQAPQLAQVGQKLHDPFLPAILSLIETSGGRNITRGQNNIFNMLPTSLGVNYPDLSTAILGGGGQKGLAGILMGGLYEKYLKSGRLEDFFTTYSPASENASIPFQVDRYNSIRNQYFQ